MEIKVFASGLLLFAAGLFTGWVTAFSVPGFMRKQKEQNEKESPAQENPGLPQSVWKEAAEENWQVFKKLRHGYINSLISIGQYARKGMREELLAYVDGLLTEVRKGTGRQKEGNTFIDAFLSYKIRRQRDTGIDFYREVMVPAELPFEEQDISLILGTAFDAAVESASVLPPGQRAVHIRIAYKKHALKLLLEYPCSSGGGQDGSLLSELERAAGRYQGMAEISPENGKNRLKILLYAGDG